MLNLSREELVIVVALLCVGITYLASKACKRASSNEREDIPGRLGLPFIGETFSFLSAYNSTRGSYDFVTPRRLRFGRWFKTRLFGKIHIFVPNSEGARIILANDFVLFNKGYVKSLAEAAGKNSLFCVPVESHKRMRRLLSEPFSMTSPSAFITKFDKKMCARLQKLEEGGQSFKVLDFCMKARRRLVETFTEIIARRRRGEESAEDFLQSMLQRDLFPASEKLDDSEIIDNMLTFIFSGQSTTATAMMWSVKFLHENKEVQDILREEQLSLSKMKPEGAPLTKEDINNMPYGWKVLKETLRMSNIVLWYPRVALQDCTIEGREIKKGWHVNIDATCVHFDPDLYKDPLKFNPQRFDETQKPYSFIPFGAGPRTCLGMYMAKLKMLIFIHRLVGGYTWTLDDLDNSLQAKELVPKLRSGCPITLKSLSKSRSEA
ncbi:abscisic acid 8'-hydroxylase 3-like isoform X2 [Lotus japonicus]|uniref:abscisic acid 8'-hydroxylase 3-like isoform X2 n=1 Tax=Lotus japonicus TaxID=34305 RepID=UPI002582A19E|nr:abscisic acid 8'-hydroxylase 3-like isoform X2 [Lotus japonicus]